MTDTYPWGMTAVIWLVFGLLAAIAALEAFCEFKGWPAMSDRIADWSVGNPWLARSLVTALFVLLAHFVMNPLHPLP